MSEQILTILWWMLEDERGTLRKRVENGNSFSFDNPSSKKKKKTMCIKDAVFRGAVTNS